MKITIPRHSRFCFGVAARSALLVALTWSLGAPYYRAQDSGGWVRTPATMTRSESIQDHLEVAYTYQFGNRIYTSTRFSLDDGAADRRLGLNLRAFPKGYTVICHVNPSNPSQAVLEQGRPPWLSAAVSAMYLLGVLALCSALLGLLLWPLGGKASPAVASSMSRATISDTDLRTLRLVHGAFIGSVLVYWGLAATLHSIGSIDSNVLLGIGSLLLVAWVLGLVAFHRVVKPSLMGRGSLSAVFGRRAGTSPQALYRISLILGNAFIESGPTYGLVLILLGAPAVSFIPYAALSLLLMVNSWPTRERFEEFARGLVSPQTLG